MADPRRRPQRPRRDAPLRRPLDLDALVDGVAGRLTEPVDLLVGHSLGAIVALFLVTRQPDAALALVLEDPPGRHAGSPDALAEGILADAAIVRRDREQLVRREREANPHCPTRTWKRR
jgi:pimeloyl-ACP methyl ester carboxylesterase